MTPQEALRELEERSTRLAEVSYEEIIYLLKQVIQRIPIPVAKLRQGSLIDRVRKNQGEVLFDRLDQLNYITDERIIREFLTEYGRGNCPHQPMFYGAVESTLVPHQRLTALAETSALFQDPAGISLEGELYTVSRWRTMEELEIAEMVFSAEAIAASPDTRRAFERQTAFLAEKGGLDADFYRELLVFISGQFARTKQTHHDYKISAAYTNLVLQHPKISGVAYPSVQTQYQGENLVLPPSTVDRSLAIQNLITQRLHKNGKYMYVNNHLECRGPIVGDKRLHWMPTAPIHISNFEEIQAALFP